MVIASHETTHMETTSNGAGAETVVHNATVGPGEPTDRRGGACHIHIHYAQILDVRAGQDFSEQAHVTRANDRQMMYAPPVAVECTRKPWDDCVRPHRAGQVNIGHKQEVFVLIRRCGADTR
jgi:hypothetical protein